MKSGKQKVAGSHATGKVVKVGRRHQKTQEVRTRIIEAALTAFTRDGFAGATLRSIAADAGITVQLLLYHFGSKEELWKAAMDEAFGAFWALYEKRALPEGEPVTLRLQRFIEMIVEFTSTKPQTLRVMVQEAGQLTPRFVWLMEKHTSRIFREFEKLVIEGQAQGVVRDLPPLRIYYAMVAIASLPYSIAAEFEYLSGKSPSTLSEIQRTIDMLEDFIFIRWPAH